jgi:hypothetical protein
MSTIFENLKWLGNAMSMQYGRIFLTLYVIVTLVFLYVISSQ